MGERGRQILNPELVEEDYEAATDIFMAFATRTAVFTLRDLRRYLTRNDVGITGDGDDFEELVDEMCGDVVDRYAAQQPPVEVDWQFGRSGDQQPVYSLGLVEHTPEGGRQLRSPVALILERTVETPVEAAGPATRDLAAEAQLSPRQREIMDLIRIAMNAHQPPQMRPHWLTDALRAADVHPKSSEWTIDKTLELGLLFKIRTKGQTYYTTEPPETERTATATGDAAHEAGHQPRSGRELTPREEDIALEVLTELAGARGVEVPVVHELRSLVSSYQGRISTSATRHLLTALRSAGLVETFVDERARRSASQRVRIGSDEVRAAWHDDRDSVMATVRSLRVKT